MVEQQPDIWVSPAADERMNGYLAPPERDGATSPARPRSTSLSPSERSRITLVEDDYTLVEHVSREEPVFDNEATKQRKGGLFDRVLGAMGLERRSKSMKAVPRQERSKSQSGQPWISPWIRPVMVFSTRRDSNRDYIHHQAQCTIDTGNVQGNIVSRDFVLDTLGYAQSAILPLTDVEKQTPGISITGHELHAEGAVYLTWYPKDSTRVFRKMRFLISKHPQHDLIIGARSIAAHNLLSVPNLMCGGPHIPITDRYDRSEDKRTRDARNRRLICGKRLEDLEDEIDAAETTGKPREVGRLNKEKDEWTAYFEMYNTQIECWTKKNAKTEAQCEEDRIAAEDKVKALEASGTTPIPKLKLAEDTAAQTSTTKSTQKPTKRSTRQSSKKGK